MGEDEGMLMGWELIVGEAGVVEGMLMRWKLIEGETGVVGEDELAESEDMDETEAERALFRAIGMGSEWMRSEWMNLFDFSFEDIFGL